MKNKNPTSFVFELSGEEICRVKEHLDGRGWEFSTLEYAFWKASKGKTKICAYKSGKLCLQGAEAYDFITFHLEPEILSRLVLNYDEKPAVETEEDAPYEAHAGIDESGKGDFFGPLVISAVFVDEEARPKLLKAGVRDSKKISDKSILKMAPIIRSSVKGAFSIVSIGPEAYNRLYEKIGNLNRLLAWGHARAIENLLEKAPNCKSAVADKFGNERLICKSLLEKGKKIKLVQRTKAESDIAVAAASVLARESFLRGLVKLGEGAGCQLAKGASAKVEEIGRRILAEKGEDGLSRLVKKHFRTYPKILGLENPAVHELSPK